MGFTELNLCLPDFSMAGVAEWARTPGDESGAVDDKQSHLPGDDCQQHEAGGCRVSWGQVSIIVYDK